MEKILDMKLREIVKHHDKKIREFGHELIRQLELVRREKIPLK